VWLQLAAIDGGVPEATVVRLHVNLSPKATLKTTLATKFHLLPQTKVLINSCSTGREGERELQCYTHDVIDNLLIYSVVHINRISKSMKNI
jgi:hypothetical protein